MLTAEQDAECRKLKELFIDKAGMTQKEFVSKYKLGTAANLGQYLNGRRAISVTLAIKMARLLDVKIEEFSPRLANEARKIGLTGSSNIDHIDRPMRKKIPVLSIVQCGNFTSDGQTKDALSAIDEGDFIYADDELPDGTFALIISGRSMEPKFENGDIVIIDPTLAPMPGDFVVATRIDSFTNDQEATFKKYRPRGYNEFGQEIFELVPLNDDFPSFSSIKEHITIIGVMIEHRRKYRRR